MQAFLFYLTYPFIYLIASLPFSVLYRVSDFFYHVLRLTGYRRDVVIRNLKNSFPDKPLSEIESIANNYYRYLCDLTFETFKTLTMSESEAKERCVFIDADFLVRLQKENRSIILIMGHYGNWEWAGPSFTLGTKFQLVVIYRPLTNPYFDRMMVGMRTKFGTRITPVSQTLRGMVADRKLLTATCFIADQAAPQDTAYWTNFLHQDTSVFTGPEKLAIKFDYPVVYINIRRPRRGFYEVSFELLFERPKETREGEISEVFMRRLEEEILLDPVTWLWSHRRWKHTRNAQ